ncbi:condensation domain-containing protein [Paenibacillus monticola]|uniref:Carrier domain-containing protein n=1 Tax=Paenibacillus monticola TaxID=2666075 RepID=A0A7X2HBU6_9BACL|nr:condensation domain-containing protein [Paenibacillus monticola]MRN57177.1 hypothetical protein [Paenibacillus monticola]
MNILELDDLEPINIEEKTIHSNEIAIIGLSIKLPQVENLNELWELLMNETEVVDDIPEKRKNDILRYQKFISDIDPEIHKYGYLNEIDSFDYNFFKISYAEACAMDPKQRLFLQSAWSAIEDAGYNSKEIKGSNTGVFAGNSNLGEYKYSEMYEKVFPSTVLNAVTGNLPALLPSRLSYIFDLKGPSMVLDTACSSSMVAIVQACQSIKDGQCDLAVVGGVRVYPFPVDNGLRLGMESSDGRTRTFDARSDGTGVCEAAISVVLAPLNEAIINRKHIYGVIKGYAVNQDGNSIGLTAPNGTSQKEVIQKAWKNAGIYPPNLTYIEAHGTGTKLGDPIEIDAINQAFHDYTDHKNFCGVGSIKTNLGHAYDTSGLVSLAKILSIYKYKEIPAMINYQSPNPQIDFENSPLYVVDSSRKLDKNLKSILCGLSSFGFSGTNCHIVLENYEQTRAVESSIQEYPMFLSAKSMKSLQEMILKYYKFMLEEPEHRLGDICYSASLKDAYDYRISFYTNSKDDMIMKLHTLLDDVQGYPMNKGFYYSENIIKDQSQSDVNNACSFYARGGSISKPLFLDCNKVSIPTYSFEKNRCWLKVPYIQEFKSSLSIHLTGKNDDDYTDYEREAAFLWGKTLDCKEISINHDYFELGGDSILAIQIANLARTEYELGLEVNEVLSHSSFGRFAELLESKHAKLRKPTLTNYPVSSTQKRMFIEQLKDTASLVNNITMVWKISAELDLQKLRNAIKRTITRHAILKSSFFLMNGEVYQKLNDLEVEMITLQPDGRTLETIISELIRPYNLSVPPLYKVIIMEAGDGTHTVIFDLHHIVTDGTSNAILMKEIQCLYHNGTLTALDKDYIDYVVWQKDFNKSQAAQDQKMYWMKRFEQPLPKPHRKNGSSGDHDVQATLYNDRITEKEYSILKGISVAQKASMFNVLLAVFMIVLSKISNNQDVTVGVPISGREHTPSEGVIGPFINTLALRNQIQSNDSFVEVLQQVKQHSLEAFQNQDYPFDEFIQFLNQQNGYQESYIHTLFIYQNMTAASDSATHRLEDYQVYFHHQSNYDLSFEATPVKDTLQLRIIYKNSCYSQEEVEQAVLLLHKVIDALQDEAKRRLAVNDYLHFGDGEGASEFDTDEILFDF